MSDNNIDLNVKTEKKSILSKIWKVILSILGILLAIFGFSYFNKSVDEKQALERIDDNNKKIDELNDKVQDNIKKEENLKNQQIGVQNKIEDVYTGLKKSDEKFEKNVQNIIKNGKKTDENIDYLNKKYGG